MQGKCPVCERNNTVEFRDLYYCNERHPYVKDVPVCNKCWYDEIRIRKINNRRYKMHEV